MVIHTEVGRVASPPLTQRIPLATNLQRDAPHSPQKCPFPFDDHTPSNTPIPRPTPLNNPNGIRIHSAILPQYTFRTDRQTDRPTGRQMVWGQTCKNTRLRSTDCKPTRLKKNISVGAQLLWGQDIFARKCMYEKLMKCAAKIMLCIFKR